MSRREAWLKEQKFLKEMVEKRGKLTSISDLEAMLDQKGISYPTKASDLEKLS